MHISTFFLLRRGGYFAPAVGLIKGISITEGENCMPYAVLELHKRIAFPLWWCCFCNFWKKDRFKNSQKKNHFKILIFYLDVNYVSCAVYLCKLCIWIVKYLDIFLENDRSSRKHIYHLW